MYRILSEETSRQSKARGLPKLAFHTFRSAQNNGEYNYVKCISLYGIKLNYEIYPCILITTKQNLSKKSRDDELHNYVQIMFLALNYTHLHNLSSHFSSHSHQTHLDSSDKMVCLSTSKTHSSIDLQEVVSLGVVVTEEWRETAKNEDRNDDTYRMLGWRHTCSQFRSS